MNQLSMSVTHAVTDSSDQILRVISNGRAWPRTSNTHSSK